MSHISVKYTLVKYLTESPVSDFQNKTALQRAIIRTFYIAAPTRATSRNAGKRIRSQTNLTNFENGT